MDEDVVGSSPISHPRKQIGRPKLGTTYLTFLSPLLTLGAIQLVRKLLYRYRTAVIITRMVGSASPAKVVSSPLCSMCVLRDKGKITIATLIGIDEFERGVTSYLTIL